MNKASAQMIFMRLIYSIFKSFVLIFVNIHLWKTGKNIKAVAVFNIFNYLAAFFSFYIANRIAIKNIKLNYLFSSLSFVFLFVITAVFEDTIAKYAILIGILGGFGDGMFFFNLNTYQASALSRDEGDKFMSMLGIVSQVSAIVTPLISGLVIEKYGFLSMVYVILILLLFQVVNALFMPNDKISDIAKVDYKKIFKNKSYRKVFSTHLIQTPFSQFVIMANSVFLYSFAKSESLMGILNSSFAVALILLYYVYIMIQKHFKRKNIMLFGAIALSVAVSLLIKPSFLTFVLFSLSMSIGDAFFSNPLVGIQVHTTKKYAASNAEMLGNLVARTSMLTISRIMFYILIYFFYTDHLSSIFKVLVLYNVCSPIITYILCKEDI